MTHPNCALVFPLQIHVSGWEETEELVKSAARTLAQSKRNSQSFDCDQQNLELFETLAS